MFKDLREIRHSKFTSKAQESIYYKMPDKKQNVKRITQNGSVFTLMTKWKVIQDC